MTQIYSYEKIRNDMRLLELLSQSVPDIGAACTEIINLEAILNLPKGTEHFLADIHGEYEAFQHILKNASGNIKRKVNEIFGTTMRESEIRQLCSLIYYPEQKLQYIKNSETNLNDFYNITLHQLVSVCQSVSSKYTRSKVRKALPKEFAYIIEELLHESPQDYNKQAYFNRIIETIVSTGRADEFICAICNLIQRLSIDQLHILGDIFDRGPGAHIIMDTLCNYRHGRHRGGQPRRALDGGGSRQRLLHCQRAAPDAPLRQPRHTGRRLRHQSGAACHVRHGNIRRRPLPLFRAATGQRRHEA